MDSNRTFNVLFLCTGNSARSIMAEAVLNEAGRGRFHAFSAGSHPTGRVNPLALEVLRRNRIRSDGARSKAWIEFSQPDSPPLDFVITVCDNAAAEVCPVWPGQPVSAHWGVPDPALAEGDEQQKMKAFTEACRVLTTRIRLFLSLPIEKLDRLALHNKLREIGTSS
jgi:arsenate reductase